MKILILNAGSSSLKYQLFDMDSGEVLAKGVCERIGVDGMVTHKRPGKENYKAEPTLQNHEDALALVIELLTDSELGVIKSVDEISAVGHRVAHGGEKYKKSALVDDEMIAYLESIVNINPLHGPPAIVGMKACKKLMPDVKMAAVFDTSFYSNFEDYKYIYPIPYELYEQHKIRRYGFHGTSHRYVAAKCAEMCGKPIEDLKIITCHLGNGSSITAVDGGVAVDTSMGFTPQGGIEMGTRSGDIDPTIVPYLVRSLGYTIEEAEDLINKKSGLLGVSGESPDSRNVTDLADSGHYRSQLALNIQYYGIKKYIGAYTAAMNGLDAVVFTAGIGENNPVIRYEVCKNMEYLGIKFDEAKNNSLARGETAEISAPDSRVRVFTIATDEEYMIAQDTAALV